jgi:hypothetical protein
MPMWRRKWFVPVVVASVLLIVGIVGGALVAASDSSSTTDDQNQVTDPYQELLDRVCAIYQQSTGVAIDSGQLNDALDQARSELQQEALESQLQNLVADGKLTQEQADSYLEWWQSRPDIQAPLPALGGPGLGGGTMGGNGFGPRGGPCPGLDTPGQAAGE